MPAAFEPGFDSRLIGLGIAIGIGFIVGLEREWAEDKPVGVRSFSLIGAAGGLCGLLAEATHGLIAAAGLIALGLVLAVDAYRKKGEGLTTIIAAVVVFVLGVAAVSGFWVHTIVIGGAVTVLLHWKKPLHRWVEELGNREFETIVRFVLISLVILPVLPNRTFGPFDIFNPFNTWLLVVLIVGINLAGYVAVRLVGKGAGAWVAGTLGGLISSTATTISYASLSRRQPADYGALAAVVILVASTVVYARVLIELAVVSPALITPLIVPSLLVSAVLVSFSIVIFVRAREQRLSKAPESKNPAQIHLALSFAAIYVVILFIVAAVRTKIGENAIFAVALLSGLTDVDALTLSVARLHAEGQTSAGVASRAIFLATLSNLGFKTAAAAVIGSAPLRRPVIAGGLLGIGSGTLILWLWP